MPFDVAAFRAGFPSLASGIAHFDNPGGTQTPAVVGEAIARTLTGPLSQRGATLVSQRTAEDAVAEFRSAVADLVGGVPGGVVHGRSATALTYDVSRTLARTWAPGEEIVLCQLDHDSNVRPWIQAAERTGVTVQTLTSIIDGGEPITGETANKLELVTGTPAALWNNLEAQYRVQLAKIEQPRQINGSQ